MARYTGLLLAPAEGFSRGRGVFLPFGKNKGFLGCFGLFQAISVVTIVPLRKIVATLVRGGWYLTKINPHTNWHGDSLPYLGLKRQWHLVSKIDFKQPPRLFLVFSNSGFGENFLIAWVQSVEKNYNFYIINSQLVSLCVLKAMKKNVYH